MDHIIKLCLQVQAVHLKFDVTDMRIRHDEREYKGQSRGSGSHASPRPAGVGSLTALACDDGGGERISNHNTPHELCDKSRR